MSKEGNEYLYGMSSRRSPQTTALDLRTNSMRLVRIIFLLLMGSGLSLSAQEPPKPLGRTRFIVYEFEGETIMDGQIAPIVIEAPRPSRETIRRTQDRIRKYTRLLWNIHRTHPYAVKLGDILDEAHRELERLPDEKSKKAYLKSKEGALFGEYEDDLRDMTRSQGEVLVKLISRETGRSSFELIKENKSGASAFLWQTVGLIFGINLKTEYDREEEAMIEEIVRELEEGGYNIYYKAFFYRLP